MERGLKESLGVLEDQLAEIISGRGTHENADVRASAGLASNET
ncbi:hypothetical protein [Nocardia brasiliensis]|nr:hypothetical protein [Nocardia brasiliensis]